MYQPPPSMLVGMGDASTSSPALLQGILSEGSLWVVLELILVHQLQSQIGTIGLQLDLEDETVGCQG